ncbi:MAG: sigma-70 family RNA polymerase sigma factor [Pseudonocardia sp.]|nr:sigma-70 family RNA polymerase sigma factor [Pseudonocardia sp.]
MRLLRSEQRSPSAEAVGQYPNSGHSAQGEPATQRVDPRVSQAVASQRAGYPVPLLPRPRPDEVPPSPPLEHSAEHSAPGTPANGSGRIDAVSRLNSRPTAMPPRVTEPRPAQLDGDQVDQADVEDLATETTETTDSDGLAGWNLVRATQAGDQEAFGQLYDRYHEMVFRYVLFRVSDRQLAEDLTAETFLRALRRISSVSYQGRDIGAWFVTIARNLVLDHVKSSRYRLEQTTAEIADLSPSTSGPEQQVVDGATHEELLRCVAKLNADQKECIALRFLQGLSVAETARLMGRNEGAVKALQHRAVRRLAQLLPEGLR